MWLSDSFVSPDLAAPVPASQARQEGGLLDLRLRRHRSFVAVASALPLLVTRVGADHHDATVATDHLALVTDLLDARVQLVSAKVDEHLSVYRLLLQIGRLNVDYLNLPVRKYDVEKYYDLVKNSPASKLKSGRELNKILQKLYKE